MKVLCKPSRICDYNCINKLFCITTVNQRIFKRPSLSRSTKFCIIQYRKWNTNIVTSSIRLFTNSRHPFRSKYKLFFFVNSAHRVICLINVLISVIVTEKKNILLRYLHQQWDKKVFWIMVSLVVGLNTHWLSESG